MGILAADRTESVHRTMVEALNEGAVILSSTGTVLFCNELFLKMVGMSIEEVADSEVARFFPPYEQMALDRFMSKAKRTGSKEEFTLLAAGGVRCSVEISVRPFSEEVSLAVITDITEHKKQEYALWESERRFRLLVDQAMDYAIITLDRNGRINHWNKGAYHLMGFAAEEILGESFERFYTREDIENEIPKRALENAKKEGRYESEGWRVRRDGSRFWANMILTALHDATGMLVGYSNLLRDITERQRASEALRQKALELEESQRLAKVGSWEWRPETDEAKWSEELYQIMDRDPSLPAYSQKDLPRLFTPETMAKFDEALQLTRQTGLAFEVDMELAHPDKQRHCVTVRGEVGERDQNGKVIKLRGTVQNITDRKRLENSLKESELFTRNILDSITTHICVLDDTGKIIKTNKAWKDYSIENGAASDYEGENYFEICERTQGPDRPLALKFAEGLRAVLNGEMQTYRQEYFCPTQVEKRWYNGLVARFSNEGPPRLVVAHDNVSSIKRVELLRTGEAHVLEQIANRAPLDLVLTNLILMIEDLGNGMIGSVMLLDEDGIHLRLASAPNLPAPYKESIAVFEIGATVGSCGAAAYRKEPVFVTDILTDPLWKDYKELLRPYNIRACWSVPVLSGDRVLGTFGMYSSRLRGPQPIELDLIDVAVRLAAIAIKQQMSDEKLRRSEQRFRNAFAGAAVSMALVDLQNRFKEVNPAFLTLTGYSTTDLMKLDVTAVTHPDDIPKCAELAQQLLSGEIPDFVTQKRFKTKSGAYVWVQNSVSLLTDAQGKPVNILLIVEDISRRKEAEEALLQSEQELRLFIKTTPAAIAIFDKNMRYRAASARWLKLFDLQGDVTGLHHYTLCPALPEHWKEIHRKALSGSVERCENDRYVHPDGSISWYLWEVRPWHNVSGEVDGISIFLEDITARMKVEKELQRSEERFRSMAESVPGIIFTCRANGEAEYFNRWTYDYTGAQQGELLEFGWMELIHPEDKPLIKEQLKKAYANGEENKLQYRLRSATGDYRWFQTAARPIRDSRGNIIQWQGSGIDIEEQKRTEELLEKRVAQRTAKLQETVNELEQYSYSITHDLRAPLRAIQGFAYLLKEESGAQFSGSALENFQNIMNSAERMENLIRDSLNYGKLLLGQVTLEPVDLTDLTLDLIQSYPVLQIPNANIRFEGEIPLVMANPAGLAQCVSNLLRNAVKFVDLGVVPHVRIWAERREEFVRIWFEDNGIGIAPEALEKIFVMFQQIDKHYEGTGIGLTIVRKAMERMGGKVGVESELGVGSRFWLELLPAT